MTAANHPRTSHPGRLVLRIYLVSLVQIVVIALSFAVLRMLIMDSPGNTRHPKYARYIVSKIAEHLSDPAALKQEVKVIREDLKSTVTVYRRDGAILINTADPVLPILSPAELTALDRDEVFVKKNQHPPVIAVPVKDNGKLIAYGLVAPPFPMGFSFRRDGLLIATILFSLAVVSIIFARSLAHPLRQLASTAHAFGAGDLSVRTHLHRSDEFGDLARAFDEMATRIERLIHSQKELLANVSHELRTPLSRIRVALDIAEEESPDNAREVIVEIVDDLVHLEQLVEDLLTAARLDLTAGPAAAAGPILRRGPVEGRPILEKAAARFLTLYPSHPLELFIEDPLPIIFADAAFLVRVINNLLDNAHKYSDSNMPVILRALDDGHSLVVEVADKGIGIEQKDLPHVFTPFFRTDRSRARTTGGVGLGLTLARRIVEAHGGTITVESESGKGTTVRFNLPKMELHNEEEI